MRADAQENRERILATAEEVFGERGAQASTEEIARRAGVGVATVFRHFPLKNDLVEAALIRHFDRLIAHASALAGAPDEGAALAELVTVMVETGATKVTLANMVSESGEFPAAAEEASRALRAVVGDVLARAQEAGAARADVSVDELYFLIMGLSHAAAVRPAGSSTTRGAVAVVLAGLAP